MEYTTTKETSQKWGVYQRRIQALCGQGRLKKAIHISWARTIPRDADKLEDKR